MNRQMMFRGFEPSEEVRNHFQRIYDYIEDLSPSDAYVEATLEKEGTRYKSQLSVHAFGAHFVSLDRDHRPTKAINTVANEIANQIIDWRMNRFQ